MVRVIEENNNTADRVTSTLFLSSLKTWYLEGVSCQITNVGKVFTTQYSKDPQIAVKLKILENMPKIRAKELDEDGNIVTYYDEIEDKQKPKISILENEEDLSVTFFFRFKKTQNNNDADKQELFIGNRTNTYPLLNYAFIQNGALSQQNTKSFIADYDEISEALLNLKFIATVETRQHSKNKTQYNVLIPKKPVDRVNNETNTDNEYIIHEKEKQYLNSRSEHIKEAIQVIEASNTPLTQKNLMQELSFMQSEGKFSNERYNSFKEIIYRILN